MCDRNLPVERRQTGDEGGRGVALDHHQVGRNLTQNGIDPDQNIRSELREVLVGPHEIEIVISLDAEELERLRDHLPVLPGTAQHEFNVLALSRH